MSNETSLSVLPATVYAEELDGTLVINFDLELVNGGDASFTLAAIHYLGLDEDGAVVLRRTVDEHGLRPGIEVIPERAVPPHGKTVVFNPLYGFRASLGLTRFELRCELTDEKGETISLEAEVRPVVHVPQAALSLPMTGRVLVANGHDFLSPHRRIDPTHPVAAQFGLRANSGRFADDFSLVDSNGSLFSGDGRNVSDWFGFGAPVRAPAAGRVLAAVGDVADNVLTPTGVDFGEPSSDPAALIFGNHVLIDHGHGEHSLLGHLECGSLSLAPGDEVEARQPIGRVGLSGNTDFVHLHYQLQDGPDVRTADGLPTRFAEIGPLEPGVIVESR